MAKVPETKPSEPRPFINIPGVVTVITLRSNNHITGFKAVVRGKEKQFNVVNHDIEKCFRQLEKFISS